MTGHPSRLVLLGHPVRHSLSPVFQRAALEHSGIPIVYEACDVPPAALAAQVRALVAERAAGNVTIPHKEAMAALCDERTPLAERTGAVNTFWVDRAGRLIGDNTDVGGFIHLVQRLLGGEPRELRIGLLGAGGAAAAVLAAAERWRGCTVTLYNRTPERAERLAARFPVVAAVTGDAAAAVRGCALVVNATPVGLANEALPIDPGLIEAEAAVVDLVYRRGGTPFVRAAWARGHKAADGLPMLVEQGALAFERWFGIPAPRAVMWRAACEEGPV